MAADHDVVVQRWLAQLPELEHIIECNGLNASDSKGIYAAQTLECFFGTIRDLQVLGQCFPNLTHLKLIAQPELRALQGLPINITELWICECALEDLAGLLNLLNLETLHIYDAGLTSAAILGQLKASNLTSLTIKDNHITNLQPLSTLTT
eukprot:m.116772 g.116772  ORF g.116772 m.116772 type:complete len:151 (+) comp15523_c0_seq6:98-550(+)